MAGLAMLKLKIPGLKPSTPAEVPEAEEQQEREAYPAKIRLRAWWEGYDVAAYAALLRQEGEAEPLPMEEEEPAEPALPPDDDTIHPIDASDRELPYKPWERNRSEVSHYIWGPEMCGPGGAENVVNMCKLLGLKPEMSMMEFGSGLGGHARALVDEFGCWVTGYERSAKLADAANELSRAAGMGRKAQITAFDEEETKDLGRQFDRAFSKEVLYTFPDKQKIVALLHAHIKPSGLLLITDYVLNSPEVKDDPDFQRLAQLESNPISPLTFEEISELFRSSDFNVRVDEDITDKFIPLVDQTWRGADQLAASLTGRSDGVDLIKVLMREGDLWQQRLKLMRDGRMKLWRIVATKVGGKPDGLSDW